MRSLKNDLQDKWVNFLNNSQKLAFFRTLKNKKFSIFPI